MSTEKYILKNTLKKNYCKKDTQFLYFLKKLCVQNQCYYRYLKLRLFLIVEVAEIKQNINSIRKLVVMMLVAQVKRTQGDT